jgi:hypothetical protein
MRIFRFGESAKCIARGIPFFLVNVSGTYKRSIVRKFDWWVCSILNHYCIWYCIHVPQTSALYFFFPCSHDSGLVFMLKL